MTYHGKIVHKLRCHSLWFYLLIHLIFCPVCKSEHIRYFGIGTEASRRNFHQRIFFHKLEYQKEWIWMAPQSKKGSHGEKILGNMKDGEYRYFNRNSK